MLLLASNGVTAHFKHSTLHWKAQTQRDGAGWCAAAPVCGSSSVPWMQTSRERDGMPVDRVAAATGRGRRRWMPNVACRARPLGHASLANLGGAVVHA